MNVFTTTHNHYYGHDYSVIKSMLREVSDKQGAIMATIEETTAQLSAVNDTLGKIQSETQSLKDEVAALKEAANNPTTTPEALQAMVENVVARVKTIDDLVPDAAPLTE